MDCVLILTITNKGAMKSYTHVLVDIAVFCWGMYRRLELLSHRVVIVLVSILPKGLTVNDPY